MSKMDNRHALAYIPGLAALKDIQAPRSSLCREFVFTMATVFGSAVTAWLRSVDCELRLKYDFWFY
jgi:hypothetical protein